MFVSELAWSFTPYDVRRSHLICGTTVAKGSLCDRRWLLRRPELRGCQVHDLASHGFRSALSTLKQYARERTVFFNNLTRSKETFETTNPDRVVRFYSCGPTVYDYAHIGNFRAFLTYDLIKRWLLFCEYPVRHITNITDVDDKIIQRSRREKRCADEITSLYTEEFFQDIKLLNIIPADDYPRATVHIDDMIRLVRELLSRGFAYRVGDSVYYSVEKFVRYGQLARLDFEGMLSNVEEPNGSEATEKRDPRDFVLWKAHKPEDGDVKWDAPFGCGRPGWHTECAAMAMKYLGPSIDIHAGGSDLVFPHHENEIAQCEALTGATFARFWLHNGFVNIDGEKMSKSLGNFITLRDLVRNPMEARAFRYAVVSSLYRTPLNFTSETLSAAATTIRRLDLFRRGMEDLQSRANSELERGHQVASESIRLKCESFLREFCDQMADDLNTARAAAVIFEASKYFDSLRRDAQLTPADASAVLVLFDQIDSVFGIFYEPQLSKWSNSGNECDTRIPTEVMELVRRRTEARTRKDFAMADALRKELHMHGFTVRDTAQGPEITPLSTSD
jgi:cysteinyl-tRNA synthetase